LLDTNWLASHVEMIDASNCNPLRSLQTPHLFERAKGTHMSFPVPTTNDPTHRYQEATDAARMALEALVADANAAGWSTDEVTVALVEAARSLKEANTRDPDPAEDPSISDIDAKQGQIGRGELFD
jgi:hypothetical protein